MNQNISEMCPFVFARCEFDCGVMLKHANYWIILVDTSTNPSQSLFNHFEDADLFSDTWFRILQFMLDLELTSLNVRLIAPNFAQRRGAVS